MGSCCDKEDTKTTTVKVEPVQDFRATRQEAKLSSIAQGNSAQGNSAQASTGGESPLGAESFTTAATRASVAQESVAQATSSQKVTNEKSSSQAASASSSTHRSIESISFKGLPQRNVLSGRYEAKIADLYDGDTMTAAIALNGVDYELFKIRLYGADTPELKGNTKAEGIKAKNEALTFLGAEGAIGLPAHQKTQSWFEKHPIIVEIEFVPEAEKYGRYLSHIRKNGESLADHLVSKKLAKAYDGKTKDQSQWMKTAQASDDKKKEN